MKKWRRILHNGAEALRNAVIPDSLRFAG